MRQPEKDLTLFVCEIRKFFPKYIGAQKTEEMADFVKQMHGTGQSLRGRDIDLTGWREWVLEEVSNGEPMLDPAEVHERNERAVITQMVDHSRLAYRYVRS